MENYFLILSNTFQKIVRKISNLFSNHKSKKYEAIENLDFFFEKTL